MKRTPTPIRSLLRDTRGASMVEYSLLLLLILATAGPAFRSVGTSVRDSFKGALAVFD